MKFIGNLTGSLNLTIDLLSADRLTCKVRSQEVKGQMELNVDPDRKLNGKFESDLKFVVSRPSDV